MILQSPAATPVKMASTTSVQNWLGQELETRGVDAVVYTRYILSIFQQDSFDLEQDPELVVAAAPACGPAGTPQPAPQDEPGGWWRWRKHYACWQPPPPPGTTGQERERAGSV